MTAWRHILMSTGLHGMFAVVAAVLLFGAQTLQEHRQTIMVHLIETTRTPAAAETPKADPVPEVQVPLMQETVTVDPSPPNRARTTPDRNRSRVLHAVAIPTARTPEPAIETLLSRSSESPPVFLEMPRRSHAAVLTAPTAPPALSLPTDGLSPSILSNTSIVPSFSRPMLSGRTESRPVLRDSSAEKVKATRSAPRAGENILPDYPPSANEAGWEGTVMLRVEVLPDGSAGSVSVKRSSGYAILDDAALRAVQRWRFRPAMDGNFPIRSVVDQPVTFNLNTS
jgi:periplasmic protein TonB